MSCIDRSDRPRLISRARLASLGGLLLGLSLLACDEVDGPGQRTVAHFEIPRGESRLAPTGFFALPFPNDIRRDPDGTISLSGFPAPNALLAKYIDIFETEVRGFGTSAGIYFRFSDSLNSQSLPADPAQTLATGASAYLLDIDPASPNRGERIPVDVTYRDEGNAYIGDNWVILLPVPGFIMREGTTYAAILTRELRDRSGEALTRDVDFALMLDSVSPTEPALAAAWAAYAPLRAWLLDSHTPPDELLNAAVFTTQNFIDDMVRLREAVYRDLPAPPAIPADLHYASSGRGYDLYKGTFEGPIYQKGEAPYATEGGGFAWDASGLPVLVRTEPIRFALSVPHGDMPAAGWPIVLYSHGTGGSYTSFVGSVAPDLARISVDGSLIAKAAVIGIDQVLHGTRCEGDTCNPELNFFNFQNPLAGRDNVRQGGLDNVQLLRLVEAMEVPAATETGQPIRFDPDRVMFMGHSQGGLTGPPFLAVAPEVKLAILSGAGGNMIQSLLTKTEPVDIPGLIAIMLGESIIDETHPVLSLIQLFIEAADPVNYGRRFIHDPVEGVDPKHILLSQGWVDHYTPPLLTEALAVATGLDLVSPWIQPTPFMQLAGKTIVLERPAGGNLLGGDVTGVLLQYPAWGNSDGHYVLTGHPQAVQDYRHFVGTWLTEGLPRILE